MASPMDLLETLQSVDIVQVASDSLSEFPEEMVMLNREQLMEGKLSTGLDITPSYFDDPFFKSREAAQRYSDWKDKITPNPKRKRGTPNLFITGPFHESLDLEVTRGEYLFTSSFHKAQDIFSKFSEDVAGLTEDSKEILKEEGLQETWQENVEKATGLKFN